MLNFYKKAFPALSIMTVLTLISGFIAVKLAFRNHPLLPQDKSVRAWQIEAISDSAQDGDSSITVEDSRFSLNFNFTLSDQAEFPFTAYALVFAETGKVAEYFDLSPYTTLTFSVRCAPANILTFALFTIDETVTDVDNINTYRLPTTFFACSDSWQQVELDLTRLETPQWWFSKFGLELSRQGYPLDKVPRFTFGSSFQSPLNVDSEIHVNELTLHGSSWPLFYVYCGCLLIAWAGFAMLLMKFHTRTLVASLQEKLKKDRPLIAYKQLSIEPQKDREKENILRYMATEYANPELNLDVATSSLGVSRTKINDILKQEIGYTFSAYLNKLRLTEAARLLAESHDISVAEIAYSVGYRNVPYFNKLFKSEYGCTPKVFKDSCKNS